MPDDLTEDERFVWLMVYATRMERYRWEHPPCTDNEATGQHTLASTVATAVVVLRREQEADE